MNRPAPRAAWALSSLLLAATPPAFSQTALRDVVVTATRHASRADALLAEVVVIDREQLAAAAGRTLTELIARQAGVQMTANGGPGKNSNLFIRGTESRHVLLLIDGVRVGAATSGQPNFDLLPLDAIERIEVLKGPASALYGSDAIGGVVQVFTRRGQQGFAPFASIGAGSGRRVEGSAGLRGGDGPVSYSVTAQAQREQGFSATNPAAGRTSFHPDEDGFAQRSLTASLDWRLTRDWKADARVFHSTGRNHYDSGTASNFDTHADVEVDSAALGIEGTPVAGWKTRLGFAASQDRSVNFTPSSTARYASRQEQWSWTNEFATPAGKVLAGFERLEQTVDSTAVYAVTRRTTDSAFTGLHGEAGPHGWQFDARHDRDSQFGSETTGLAAYGYRITPALRAHASYGTAFKAPTFNALYFPAFGNPALRPERARNAEVGLRYSHGVHLLSIVRFDNRLSDLIAYAGPGATPVNIDRARLRGWTLGYEAQRGAWGVQGALDLLDARNLRTGARLPRRAERQLTASADHRMGDWKLGATLLAASERFDTIANTVRLGGFATLDLFAQRRLARDWSAQLRLNNLADKQYQTANGYNQPGRAVYVTLRWQPE